MILSVADESKSFFRVRRTNQPRTQNFGDHITKNITNAAFLFLLSTSFEKLFIQLLSISAFGRLPRFVSRTRMVGKWGVEYLKERNDPTQQVTQ